MEHHSLPELPGQLILTNSELKVSVKGQQYITIYFEQRNKDGSDFNSMQIDRIALLIRGTIDNVNQNSHN